MKFPERYIKRGKFKLHSGQTSNILYDVNSMITNNFCLRGIKEYIHLYVKPCATYVGIATGGAIIANSVSLFQWAMIKDKELKGKIKMPYILIDDVCTTESSIKEAIKIIGKKPKHIFVVVDRRKKKTLEIQSMYNL